jgi:flagellar biosynthesis protein FlhG
MPSHQNSANANGSGMLDKGPIRVVCVASGKGGVGKTNSTINLSLSLARMGRRVMILDADMGLANVDVLLGLNTRRNVAHMLDGQCDLRDILIEGPLGVKIVPGSSGLARMGEIAAAQQAGLIAALGDLQWDLDVMLIDSASGISPSVLTFARAAQEVLVVVCDEPASLTDAYALIKVLSRDYDVNRFHVVANRVATGADGQQLFSKLLKVCERFLDVDLRLLGYIPEDELLRRAVNRQRAVVQAYPGSKAAKAYGRLAQRLDALPFPTGPSGYMELFVDRLIQQSAPTDLAAQ